jgi:HEAT repeat protein
MAEANPELVNRVRRVLEKLGLVRARGLSCFGSDAHCFRLSRPLSEAEVVAFERERGIKLPEDYRTFLIHAGNGGAGPYYGINPLKEWSDFLDWVMDERPADVLSRPCPLFPDIEKGPDWEEQLQGVPPYQGTLTLGTQGCSYAMQLIVTGAHRGRVVYVDADGNAPYLVWDPDFLSWYERWPDELLGGYGTSWFGFGPGGGEQDFARLLEDPSLSAHRRSEVAHAFIRLPKLSRAGAAFVQSHLGHASSGVRAGLCRAVRRFKLLDAEGEVGPLLSATEAEVRQEAVRTLLELAPGRWKDRALASLLSEQDPEVASSIFFALQKIDALGRAQLLRIISESSLGNVRAFAVHSMSWTAADLDLLIRLLSDSNVQVRTYAVFGLNSIKAREAAPALVELLEREKDLNVMACAVRLLGEVGDESVGPTLLRLARFSDDFLRLDAIGALAKLGDERVIEMAEPLLGEQRKPERKDADGFTVHSSSVGELVRKALAGSPAKRIRVLADR